MTFLRLSLGLLALTLVGCESGPSVEPVTGTVTLDGAPISGAVVTFSPVDTGSGSAAVGTTDANGTYGLTDMASKSAKLGGGAVAGNYNVAIMWYKPSDPSSASATGDSSVSETVMSDDKESATTVAGPDALLPEAYKSGATSGLTATIKSGPNTFDFQLDSKYTGPAAAK